MADERTAFLMNVTDPQAIFPARLRLRAVTSVVRALPDFALDRTRCNATFGPGVMPPATCLSCHVAVVDVLQEGS
jgi:hypothetical protein